jgi:2-dehydropantoate 2-reductase
MRVAVMGAGAVGSLLGGLLSQKHEVTLIGRADHMAAIRKDGLRIEGEHRLVSRPNTFISTAGVPIQDLILVTVKAYDSDEAVHAIRPMVGPGTMILLVQNGLDILHSCDRIGFAKVHLGLASLGVTYIGPGKVHFAGKGEITIGCRGGRTGKAVLLQGLFNEVGLPVKITRDIIGAVWRKVVINASINPLTAIAGVPNGAILEDGSLYAISRELFEEANAVAVHLRALRPGELGFEDVLRVVRDTAKNRSSMLQDLERGKCTEVGSINGAICALARDPRMVTANRIITEMVRSKEKGRR